jgi:sulfur carrier protein ThiS
VLVRVQLQLTFKDKTPHGENPFDIELAAGTTIVQALNVLSIPESAPKVILVNGRVAYPGRVLNEGDQLTVFPPLEGG